MNYFVKIMCCTCLVVGIVEKSFNHDVVQNVHNRLGHICRHKSLDDLKRRNPDERERRVFS